MKFLIAARKAAGLLACAGFAAPLWAAGGHHDVDDAAILETGHCELETWAGRAPDASGFVHGGVNCGAGPVELGIGGERPPGAGQGARQLQLKTALPLGAGWSAGAALGQSSAGGEGGVTRTWVALLTWSAEPVALHLNAGQDRVRGAGTTRRAGAGIDWTFRSSWMATAEVFRLGGANSWRAGVRHELAPGVTVDLSRAASLDGRTPVRWTAGASWEFGG